LGAAATASSPASSVRAAASRTYRGPASGLPAAFPACTEYSQDTLTTSVRSPAAPIPSRRSPAAAIPS
jgi:hypothetical protein